MGATNFIGQSIKRKEDYRFLTGEGSYTDDIVLPRQSPFWGLSSAGRAPALQAGGRRFDPDRLHHV